MSHTNGREPMISYSSLSARHLEALMRVDDEAVGTKDYLGLAYFWAYEYRHPLRECSFALRRRVHAALLTAGLAVNGESKKHLAIINRITAKFQAEWAAGFSPKPVQR